MQSALQLLGEAQQRGQGFKVCGRVRQSHCWPCYWPLSGQDQVLTKAGHSKEVVWRKERGGPWCVTKLWLYGWDPKIIWLCSKDCTHPCARAHHSRLNPWLSAWLSAEIITLQPRGLGAALPKTQRLEKASVSLQHNTETQHMAQRGWLHVAGWPGIPTVLHWVLQ